MGFFNDAFGGGIFDFNGDGEITWNEEALGFMIFEEIMKEGDESEMLGDFFEDF